MCALPVSLVEPCPKSQTGEFEPRFRQTATGTRGQSGARACRGNGYNEIRQLSFGLDALLNTLATKLPQRIDVAVCGMSVIGGYLGEAVIKCIL
jgi:hypothetical protein